MSKRIPLFALIALILVILSCCASARTLVSYGDEQIYVGGYDYPYSPETGERYISARVYQSLYKNDGAYCFTQLNGYNPQSLKIATENYGGRMSVSTVDAVAFDPVYCQYDDAIYYVAADDPGKLMSYNPRTGRKIIAYRSNLDIDGLMDSANGLLVGEDGEYFLYEARRKRLTDLNYDPTGSAIRVFGDCHVEITSGGEIYVLTRGESERKLITRSGTAAWRMDDDVYYLQSFSTSARLSRYNLGEGRSHNLTRVGGRVGPTLVACEGMAYMINEEGDALRYDVASSRLETAGFIGEAGAKLEIAGDYIVAYESGETGAFIDLIEKSEPKPVYETLRRGSRGDGVVRLQQKLRDNGYLASSADGVFGSGTERALRLMQFDMGYGDTGVATPDFQREIFENGAPIYKQYVTLRYGSSGIRVEELAARLRELYYTKRGENGGYDDDIADAVERFQSRMGYRENGDSITASQLKALVRSSAPECETYYTLSRHDSAPVVKRLNRRLRALGYLSSGHVNESYSSYTVKAVKKFQNMIYFDATGIADPDTQYELFSEYAPTPEPDPTPTPTPTPEPTPEFTPEPTFGPTPEPTYGPVEPVQVVKDSVINTMRTWMRNNLGGSYPKDYAVYTLQMRLAEIGYMSDLDINSVYDLNTKQAVESFQSDYGLNINGNANKKTLAAMFLDF